jgi:hypothetical protein
MRLASLRSKNSPHIVIVGTGLGGCVLAHALRGRARVTMVELEAGREEIYRRVADKGLPAVTSPHVGCGLGGTTVLWHNGLIEIGPEVFARAWPFSKQELAPYYRQAWPLLGGITPEGLAAGVEKLRQKSVAAGLPARLLGAGLFYPRARRNVWKTLGLARKVELIRGEVREIEARHGQVRELRLSDGRRVGGDIFVLAAGGLSTPLLLQRLARRCKLPGLRQAGRFYEDHPLAFVGQVTLRAPLYRLWNFPVAKGNLRLPLVMMANRLAVSFQLRPAINHDGRWQVRSVLNDLRNRPYDPRVYFRLLRHADDILDILSFRFGLHWPTRHYTLLMVAEQPADAGVDIDGDRGRIRRRWALPPAYRKGLEAAARRLVKGLGGMVETAKILSVRGWEFQSSSHHSGTARLALTAREGVCDPDGRVFGLNNLYVCDGSLIPASGHANTGLTIAALALRLGEHLAGRHIRD